MEVGRCVKILNERAYVEIPMAMVTLQSEYQKPWCTPGSNKYADCKVPDFMQ